VVIVAHALEEFTATSAAGNCVNVFGTLIGFTIFEPLIIYYTLLQVSNNRHCIGAMRCYFVVARILVGGKV
jgi:hypothetical protein